MRRIPPCASSPSFTAARGAPSGDLHIFKIARLAVDADARRSDPARIFPRLMAGLHQRADEGHVVVVGQPAAALRASTAPRVRTSPAGLMRLPPNSPIRRLKPLCGWTNLKAIPAFSTDLFQRSIPPWQSAMKSSSSRALRARKAGTSSTDELAVNDPGDRVGRVLQHVIVALEIRFVEAALDPGAERFGGVAGDFAAEQVAGRPKRGSSACAAGAAGRPRRACAPPRRRWDP